MVFHALGCSAAGRPDVSLEADLGRFGGYPFALFCGADTVLFKYLPFSLHEGSNRLFGQLRLFKQVRDRSAILKFKAGEHHGNARLLNLAGVLLQLLRVLGLDLALGAGGH